MMAHDALSAKLRETTQKLRRIGSEEDSTPDEEEYERDLKEMNELVTMQERMSTKQTIELKGEDNAGPTSIFRFEVNIHASENSSTTREGFSPGSSKVTVGTITSHQFAFKFQYGNLVASTSEYLAYILEGRNGFVVRVVHQDSSARGLLKDFTGAVVDLAFAHAGSNMLACVDQGGNIHVFKITVEETAVVGGVVLSVKRSDTPDDLRHRLVWCPHVGPGEGEVEGEEDGECLMLAVSHGCEAEVLDLDAILEVYGDKKTMRRSEVVTGVKVVEGAHTEKINDLSLSPDGNVMATAGADGHVKFWKVDTESSDPPSCLQDWKPHDGFPVTRILFCDDHQHSDPSSQTFWRFLITGADRSAELKLWCTVTWQCLQTLRFLPPVNDEHEPPVDLVVNLDLSACYCIAADSRRKVLYVLQLQQDAMLGQASFTSLREYVLSQPVLSFVPAGPVLPVEGRAEEDLGLGEGTEDTLAAREASFDCRRDVVTIRLYCIQTRSVQELSVQYEPHDLLMHLPPQLHQESELDRRYSSLMEESKGGSDKAKPSDESAGEEEREAPLPLSMDMDPLDPNLMPRPLLCSTVDSTSGSGLVERTGEMDVTDTSANLPVVGEGAGSGEGHEVDEVGQSSSVAPSGSSLVSSQSITTTGGTSLYEDVSPLEGAESGASSSQLESVSKNLSRIHELLGMPEPDVSSVVSSSQSGGDVESFLSRFTSGAPVLSVGDSVVSHTLEDTRMSGTLPETTQESGEEFPSPVEDDTAGRSGGGDKAPSPDTQAEGDPLQKWPDVGDLGPASSSSSPAISTSPGSSTPPDPTAPDPDWDSGQLPELLPSHQTEGERVLDPPLLGISQLVQEAVSSSVEQSTEPGTAGQDVFSEPVLPLPPQTVRLTGSDSSSTHLVSPPVGASKAPTMTHPPPSKVLPMMKGVKLGVVKKSMEEDGLGEMKEKEEGLSGPRDEEEGLRDAREKEEGLSELRVEEEGLSGPRVEEEGLGDAREKEEGLSGLRVEEEGLGDAREKEGLSGPRVKEEGLGDAREKEGLGESRDKEALGDSKEKEGLGDAREKEGLRESREKEGLGESKEKEEPVGSLSEDTNMEEAEEEETPHDSSYRDQLVTSCEQEGVVMWTQYSTDVKVDPLQSSSQLTHLEQEIMEQRQEIVRLREDRQQAEDALLDRVQSMLSAHLHQQQQMMEGHIKQQQQQLESLTKEQRDQEKQRTDRLASSLSQTAANAVQSRLEKVVKAEMKNAVVPVVTRSLNGLADQISSTVSQRLAAVETTTKDAVVKMVKSQMVADSIAGAVVADLQPVLLSILDKTFKATSGNMVDAFERACKDMYSQINQAFNAGTSQYLSQLQQHLERHRKAVEGVEYGREASMKQLVSTVQGLPVLVGERQAAATEQVREVVQGVGQRTVQEVSQLLKETLPELVAAQVSKCFEENMSQFGMDSERGKQQRKSKVDALLGDQNYDAAFNEALTHSDLELVIYLCGAVDPDKLFDQALLSQPVLLSLIQHLAVDLSNSLDLKLQYLEGCLMAIDDQNSLVRSHLSEVLGGLTEALKTVEASLAATQPAKARAARKLRMLTERISQ